MERCFIYVYLLSSLLNFTQCRIPFLSTVCAGLRFCNAQAYLPFIQCANPVMTSEDLCDGQTFSILLQWKGLFCSDVWFIALVQWHVTMQWIRQGFIKFKPGPLCFMVLYIERLENLGLHCNQRGRRMSFCKCSLLTVMDCTDETCLRIYFLLVSLNDTVIGSDCVE
jgi:hypothetical protein